MTEYSSWGSSGSSATRLAAGTRSNSKRSLYWPHGTEAFRNAYGRAKENAKWHWVGGNHEHDGAGWFHAEDQTAPPDLLAAHGRP
jgi:hypothetical protein